MFDNWIIRSFIGPKDQGPQAEGQELPIQPRSSETWRESFNRYLKLWSSSPDDSDPLSDQEPKDQSKGKGFNKKKAFLRLCALGALSLLPLIAAENRGSGLQVQDLSPYDKESGEICRPKNIFWPQCDSEERLENTPAESLSEQELMQIGEKIIKYRDLVQQTLDEFDQRIEKKLDEFDQHREKKIDKSIEVVMKELRKTQRELQATQQELRKTQRKLKNARGELGSMQWRTLGAYVMWAITMVSMYYLSKRQDIQSERQDIQRRDLNQLEGHQDTQRIDLDRQERQLDIQRQDLNRLEELLHPSRGLPATLAVAEEMIRRLQDSASSLERRVRDLEDPAPYTS